MTLDRHRSKLIPDIDFTGDGRIFVTDNEGTFPIAGQGKNKNRTPANEIDYNEIQSFRSFDPKRDEQRRKFRPRESNRFAREVEDLPGTLRSSASSMQRKLRRLRRQSEPHEEQDELQWPGTEQNGDVTLNGTIGTSWSEINSKKKKEKTLGGSLGRSSGTKPMDMDDIRQYREMHRKNSMLEMAKNRDPYIPEEPASPRVLPPMRAKNKRLAEEAIPGIFFIIFGFLLMATGVAMALLSWWHVCYAILWTGALVLMLGILGVIHKKDYLTRWKNFSYVIVGGLASLAVLVCSGVLLYLLVPLLTELAKKTPAQYVATNVTFTNMLQSNAITLAVDDMVWATVGLGIASFTLCLVNFFTLTATVVALGNHWDATFKVTGSCDHRGHPRFFNPIDQMALGQATFVLGMVAIALADNHENRGTYMCPVWTVLLVILAAIASLVYGKRPDVRPMATVAIVMEAAALVACMAASVVILLTLADAVQEISEMSVKEGPEYSTHVATSVSVTLFVVTLLINVVFAVGVIFRHCRLACCACCYEVLEE